MCFLSGMALRRGGEGEAVRLPEGNVKAAGLPMRQRAAIFSPSRRIAIAADSGGGFR